jgi:prephenate dehydrogenase
LGAGTIVLAEPAEHDEMIAFTSQLPHALAVAYVLAVGERDPLPFSAGSYRDVSRVAAINAPMWAELFVENQPALLAEMKALRSALDELERLLAAGDRQGLTGLFAQVAKTKEERL